MFVLFFGLKLIIKFELNLRLSLMKSFVEYMLNIGKNWLRYGVYKLVFKWVFLDL